MHDIFIMYLLNSNVTVGVYILIKWVLFIGYGA